MATRTIVGMDNNSRRILDFEQRHPMPGALKRNAIRVELGMTPVRYEQTLVRLLATSEALEIAPMVVHRRERLASVREARRTARIFG